MDCSAIFCQSRSTNSPNRPVTWVCGWKRLCCTFVTTIKKFHLTLNHCITSVVVSWQCSNEGYKLAAHVPHSARQYIFCNPCAFLATTKKLCHPALWKTVIWYHRKRALLMTSICCSNCGCEMLFSLMKNVKTRNNTCLTDEQSKRCIWMGTTESKSLKDYSSKNSVKFLTKSFME